MLERNPKQLRNTRDAKILGNEGEGERGVHPGKYCT